MVDEIFDKTEYRMTFGDRVEIVERYASAMRWENCLDTDCGLSEREKESLTKDRERGRLFYDTPRIDVEVDDRGLVRTCFFLYRKGWEKDTFDADRFYAKLCKSKFVTFAKNAEGDIYWAQIIPAVRDEDFEDNIKISFANTSWLISDVLKFMETYKEIVD